MFMFLKCPVIVQILTLWECNCEISILDLVKRFCDILVDIFSVVLLISVQKCTNYSRDRSHFYVYTVGYIVCNGLVLRKNV